MAKRSLLSRCPSYFNANFKTFFKLIKVLLLVSELYIKIHADISNVLSLTFGIPKWTLRNNCLHGNNSTVISLNK